MLAQAEMYLGIIPDFRFGANESSSESGMRPELQD